MNVDNGTAFLKNSAKPHSKLLARMRGVYQFMFKNSEWVTRGIQNNNNKRWIVKFSSITTYCHNNYSFFSLG